MVELLDDLGGRRHTNLLVEGGPRVLASFFGNRLVDEVWTFIAPRIIGHDAAPPLPQLPDIPTIDIEQFDRVGGDVFLRGLVT